MGQLSMMLLSYNSNSGSSLYLHAQQFDQQFGSNTSEMLLSIKEDISGILQDISSGDPERVGHATGRLTWMIVEASAGSKGASMVKSARRAATAAKTGGRLGNAAKRSQIDNIATTLESRGYTITGGGGRTAEEFLKPLGGGRKGGSFLDITATHPNYPTLRINTVDVYKNGWPTLRELNNAARIRTQIAPGEHLLLIPKR